MVCKGGSVLASSSISSSIIDDWWGLFKYSFNFAASLAASRHTHGVSSEQNPQLSTGESSLKVDAVSVWGWEKVVFFNFFKSGIGFAFTLNCFVKSISCSSSVDLILRFLDKETAGIGLKELTWSWSFFLAFSVLSFVGSFNPTDSQRHSSFGHTPQSKLATSAALKGLSGVLLLEIGVKVEWNCLYESLLKL